MVHEDQEPVRTFGGMIERWWMLLILVTDGVSTLLSEIMNLLHAFMQEEPPSSRPLDAL